MKRTMLLAAAFAISLAGVPAFAQQQPERSNKAGEVRGKDRAAQVREKNADKKVEKKAKPEKAEKSKKKS
jgi:hypothetical protein